MNKIGKMEENNNEVLELEMKGQEKPKKWSELSTEDIRRLREATLRHFEEYINSDSDTRKDEITQILAECRFDTKDPNNRIKVSQIISSQKRIFERENDEDSVKHRNRFT